MSATWLLLTIAAVLALAETQNDSALDPAGQQVVNFKKSTSGPIGIMTTRAGAPIDYRDTSTINKRLIFNEYFMDSITHMLRERTPPRVVHAKAGGAFGYFEVTNDITNICKANLFSKVGKRTPVAARFSPVLAERGGVDTARDTRGFAVKFYTEDGNFDIAGFNTPMYAYKDPILFPTFVRAQKHNPATNLIDGNTLWDYLTLRPESLHMFFLVFGDRGIPDGYRHMPGFGIHSYQVSNAKGEKHFIRFHFYPTAGIKNLRSEEARNISAFDPDFATRDLYNAIAKGDFPSWDVKIQVLTDEDVQNAGFDVFDVTKVLPLDIYPLIDLGKMVLNRNAVNYFAEIEQLAFCPANLVPGIQGGPDKLFEARRLAYRDAQNYRLGVNFNKITVNCPLHGALTYNRDGIPPVQTNEYNIPNYYPNTFHGPIPYNEENRVELIDIQQNGEANNFDQARALYDNEMTTEERSRLVENVLYSLGPVDKELQQRAVYIFKLIHPDLGGRIEAGLINNQTGYIPTDCTN